MLTCAHAGTRGLPMLPVLEAARSRGTSMVILGWMLAAWPAGALGQEVPPWVPPATAPSERIVPAADGHQDILDRLRKMEQRLDGVTKQNQDLLRENATLK